MFGAELCRALFVARRSWKGYLAGLCWTNCVFVSHATLSCVFVGAPIMPNSGFLCSPSRPPHNRKGYNARDFVPSRVEVIVGVCSDSKAETMVNFH